MFSSWSSTQLNELVVVFCTAYHYFYGFSKVKSALAHAQAKSGPVRPDTVPSGLWGNFFTVLQVFVCHIVSIVYIFAVVGSGLEQPAWMSAVAFPEVFFGIELDEIRKNALRHIACVLMISITSMADVVFQHLDDQYHPIGRREKPRVVQTGPYAWVRHPLYSLALLFAVSQAIAFWSYAPLFALVAIAVVFGIKISIEEEAIQRDDAIREEYRAYMRKVPAKLVPYIW